MARNKDISPSQGAPVAPAAAGPVPPVATPAPAPAVEALRLFKIEDWIAALVTFLFSGCVFFYHMAPEITLQDSGELVTGAFNFGVPHPPGYPFWAFLGYVWSHFIVPFGNPAWRIGTMSVVTGAMVVAVMTLMMTRSLRLILDSLPWAAETDEGLRHWMALMIGAGSALLFGFNRGVWLWACVSEMRVLNVFSFVLIACIFFIWMLQPHRRFYLYATILLLGLSLANHQTVAIVTLALGVGTLMVGLDRYAEARSSLGFKGSGKRGALVMTSLADAWELAAAAALSGAVALTVLAWLLNASREQTVPHGVLTPDAVKACMAAGGLAVVAVGILVTGANTGWWNVRRALTAAGLFLLGLSFYAYMPLAASTNPPMNWGYAATREGFLHAISRGQYEKVQTAHFFSEEFLLKIWVFMKALVAQYSLPLTLIAVVGVLAFLLSGQRWRRPGRSWMVFVIAAFVATSLGLLTIINPKLDRQEQEINLKFFAPAHGFFAMLIGYGIAFLLSGALWRWPRLPRILVRLACMGLLALPVITYQRNRALCGLRGYDFGYKFGYLMFEPGGGYPSMEKDAVLYGGTDPGRFVPTYMIFCESRVAPKDRFFDEKFDRSDVYIITQNALADNTYMSYIRDHYDLSRPPNTSFLQKLLHRDHTYPVEPIHIPNPGDLNKAFQEYMEGIESGRIPRSADVKFENGRMVVQGVQGVMAINGILAKWIFDRNKDRHAFYVEESYVISWMYPHLRPSGIIMKIEKEPLPSPQEAPQLWQEIVARDRDYWGKLTAEFVARPDFARVNGNGDAKKSFSKLRSAIAGLYTFRGMIPEAEEAFLQSLKLCPESPEANFRLADLYMQLRRFSDARRLMEDYLKVDEYNGGARGMLEGIKATERDEARRLELERAMGQGAMDIRSAVELTSLYQRFNMDVQFLNMARNIMAGSNMPAEVYGTLAQICINGRKLDMAGAALKRYLEMNPGDYRAWVELGCAELGCGKAAEAMSALTRAVGVGGEQVRGILRQDSRLVTLRSRPDFRALAVPASAAGQLVNPALSPFLRP